MMAPCMWRMGLRNLDVHPCGRGLVLYGRTLVVILFAIILNACAQHSTDQPGRSIHISPDLTLILPRPSELAQSVEATQLVTARYGAQSYAFEGHISATPERFLMVGLDSLGRRSMTITWTEAAITYEAAPWLPPQLRPENVLADMVLLYWPDISVQRALESSGGSVISTPGSRTITKNGKPIVLIEYDLATDGSFWSGRLSYRNLAFKYDLEVLSVRSDP